MNPQQREALEQRLGRMYVRQRLGIEQDKESRVFGQGINFFHLENWYSVHAWIRRLLKATGVYGRGRRNALRPRVVENHFTLTHLPKVFEGVTILQLSDLHLDMHRGLPEAIGEAVRNLEYDVCVLTGDYRAKTYGDFHPALEGLAYLVSCLRKPIYAVLGNHDSIRMVPGMEQLGIEVLLNESVVLERDGQKLFIAGVDDAHYYRADNLEKAGRDVPYDAASILLSHTPELYKHAAHGEFDIMLSGHTHGGQICLPGGRALMYNASCPDAFCRGAWRFHQLQGYTSVGAGVSIVDARFNCPPEVTLHRFYRAEGATTETQ